MNFKTIYISTIFLLAFSFNTPGHDQIPGHKPGQPIALVGATIHPISSAPIEDGVLIISDGKIAAVGKDVSIPANSKRIDVSGQNIYPGFIACNTTLGLVEVNRVWESVDTTETTSIKPNIRAEVAFNPDSELIPVSRSTGITMAQVVPQGGRMPGTSALMMTDGWTWEEMTLNAPAGLHINWPGMGFNREAGGKAKESRDQPLKELNDVFADARAYWKAKEAEAERGIPYHNTDARWHSMKPVLDGEVPVIVNANSIRQMQAAIQWAKEQNLKLILMNGQDAWRIADQLKDNHIPVIIDTPHQLQFRSWEPFDTAFTHAAKLHEAGVKFAFSHTGMPGIIQNFPYQVASAVAYGLPRDAALEAMTLDAAGIFGVDQKVGSLEAGKDATLFVCDGDPLDIRSSINHMYIQGRPVELESKHTDLYNKYKTKYERMEE